MTVPTPPRVPLLDAPDDPATRDIFTKLRAERRLLNLHRAMGHAPALLRASNDMALAFRKDTQLPRLLIELIILRTAQIVDCAYVRERHVPHARAAGVNDDQMAQLADRRDTGAFTPAEQAALDFTDEVARRTPIAEPTLLRLREYFGSREIVEIAMLVGFYVSTATFIAALAIPDESA
jgi:4-carboxymuconolactone decarboxylase